MFLTKNELEVMNTLWKAETEVSRADIIELSPERSWKDNSIHTILNSLMKKGMVKVVGMKPAGKIFARTFAADMSYEAYLATQISAKPTKSKPAIVGLFSALLKEGDISRETIDELQNILDEFREKAE